ncbi:MAG TPA: cytochrome c biogenesis heme-transporting ATPase CcmA [Burkholderiales bacterium]|nr:cytochrome c biogenesis heme-transporting ATPase CcmA [Burkholderiales bacterium]
MLDAADLECARGGRTLFRGLSLALRPGDLVRVAGDNGRGKTSLLRILCGLLTPDAGTVAWRGEPVRRLGEEFAKELVYLGHAPAVKDDLTAAENLRVALRLSGRVLPDKALQEALRQFGVPEGRPVGRMSQGQRRRAALARLAVSDAPLWLLDEPLAALDAPAAALVESLVEAHAARGGMTVVTTHQASRLSFSRTVDLDAAHA